MKNSGDQKASGAYAQAPAFSTPAARSTHTLSADGNKPLEIALPVALIFRMFPFFSATAAAT